MAKGTAKKLAIGTAVAAGVGYVAGVLTAPKSGKETRQDLKQAAEKGVAEAEKQLKHLSTELNDLAGKVKSKGSDLSERAKKELESLVAKAKDSKDKAHDVLGALHHGDAEDKDLKKAIDDATKSIEHLRDYLSK